MTTQTVDCDIPSIVQAAIARHGAKTDALIPILSEINNAVGYIPAQAFHELREQIHHLPGGAHVSEGQLYSVASFYDMLATEVRGRHVVKFCENAPCHVVGSKAVWEALEDQLGVTNGETTADSKWTLLTTSCLGLCSVGPVLLIDGDVYGNVTPEQVGSILERYE